jgi:hypothetical protein
VLDTSFAFTVMDVRDRPVPTELFKRRGPRGSLADVEPATAEYVNWFNTGRLHTAIGGIPPAEHEAAYYAQDQPIPGLDPTTGVCTKPGTVHRCLTPTPGRNVDIRGQHSGQAGQHQATATAAACRRADDGKSGMHVDIETTDRLRRG